MEITLRMTVIWLIFLPIFAYAGVGCPELGDMECKCPNYPNYCITTGNSKFTYYKIGNNLVDYVAKDADINLIAVEGGSINNVKKMRWQHGIKFAVVQSDVLEHYRKLARSGNRDAADLIKPLRVILPLYNEELHVFVSADSEINFLHELKNKKIALGALGGGSAMTGLAMYNYMFEEDISSENAFFSSFDEALRGVADGTVDAWIMVVGQPAQKFLDMSPEAKKYIKLLKFDPDNATDKKILNGPYYRAFIKKESYSWLDEDVPTVTVKAFLVTQKYARSQTKRDIENFTKALCRNFPRLQAEAHPKWRDVTLEMTPLPGGWAYSDDVMRAFNSGDCNLGKKQEPCLLRDKILGLCK